MPYKLYTLRHEKRNLDNHYFSSPLTDEGKYNSLNKTIDLLEENTIDIIYTSPFVRCIDTILPYANKHNIPIHVDYRLYEWYANPDFEDVPVQKIDEPSRFSSITKEDICINYPESSEDRNKRVSQFMNMLEEKYQGTHLNVLVCAHMDIVNDVIAYKLPIWPRGYISMGTLVDIQQAMVHMSAVLIVYAHFCNHIIPVLLRVLLVKKSLKHCVCTGTKQCKRLLDLCTSTKMQALDGSLKEKTTALFSKIQQCLTGGFLQMKSVWAKQ